MTKEQILHELARETYATLKPSPVHGIGVFAIRDIPMGCRDFFSKKEIEWIKIPIREAEQLPDHSRNLVETYCVYDDEHYFVPNYGFKIVDMVNYLNHSSSPNVVSINHGEYFEAIVDITAGEELLVNYTEIVKTDDYN